MLTRREFLGAAAAAVGASTWLSSCLDTGPLRPSDQTIEQLTITSRPGTPSIAPEVGYTALGLATPRDGFLYVPPTYDPAVAAPLLVMLHGAGGSSDRWRADSLRALLDAAGMVLLAPESRYSTWDLAQVGTYDVDVEFMDSALAHTFARCNIDPANIAIGGFSDGASESLGIGAANAGVFTRVVACSPGVLVLPFIRGYPAVFVSHGVQDPVLSFANTRDRIVPGLRQNGMAVEFVTFQGGHSIPEEVERDAFTFLATPID